MQEFAVQLEGTVCNGVVVLEPGVAMPDGTRVTVTPYAAESASPTHFDLFHEVIGQATGLPEDMALNHNHYIRGGPKQ